MSLDE
jgi:hypothetical protein